MPGPKFDYKLARLDRLAAHAAELLAAGVAAQQRRTQTFRS